MYKLVDWSPELDLSDFYRLAAARGFENNSSQRVLVDSFKNELESKVWILYYNDVPVGSAACHSLDIFENKSYRICARTCVFTDLLPLQHLRSRGYTIQKHQNATAQFFIPKCIEWAPSDADLYISTNSSEVASQDQVHRIYCPALVETGALEKTTELSYRGHLQTFWKLNREVFLDQLNQLPRWD
jgi:hypothetical protein